jgi:hypothetical protein
MASTQQKRNGQATVEKKLTAEYFLLPCKIARGLFTSERQITIRLLDGRQFVAFVDERNVKEVHAPNHDNVVDGWVKVSPVKMIGEDAWVDLPQGSLTEGPRIQVSSKQLTQA